MSDIKVSICCLAFNHEPFIRQCLDGFVSQKTSFAFEVLIHDDASTDKTAEIIREFEQKYPEIIKPIYQTENQYSKGVSVTRKYNLSRAKGEYIAICEGDDYWIDPVKLQKQVDFLDSHPEYTLTHSDTNIHVNRTDKIYSGINKIKNRTINSGDVFLDKLETNFRIFTCTTLFRNDKKIFTYFDEHKNYLQGDLILFLELSKAGLVKYFDDCMATYRINQGSITQSKSSLQEVLFKQSSLNIRLTIAKKYKVKQSIIDKLRITYNKIVLEEAYLKNDAELMSNTVALLNEDKVQLNRDQKYKISIVLDKGFSPLVKKMILKITNVKSKVIHRLSDYKNRYI